MKIFKDFFGFRPQKQAENDFSAFFHASKSGEKKKVLKQAIRGANKDQKELVEKYEKLFAKTAN